MRARVVAKGKSVPKHLRVREALRKKIDDGTFPPGSKLPPETQLFQLLKASNTTVVRALNDLVREGLIVRRRGIGSYVSDRTSPPLVPGRILRLGLLMPFPVRANILADGFYGDMVKGALKEWGVHHTQPTFKEDSSLNITSATWHQPERGLSIDWIGELRHSSRCPSIKAVRSGRYDGLMTLGIVESKWMEKVIGLNIPLTIIDFPNTQFNARADQVIADPQAGYAEAVNYLVSQGLKKIHYVGALRQTPGVSKFKPTPNNPWPWTHCRIDPDSFLRLSAYRQAMDANGIKVPEQWIHHVPSLSECHKLLAEHLAQLPKADRPEALVCNQAGEGEYLIKVLAELGIPIQSAGAASQPSFGATHHMRISGEEMGTVAADLLLSRIRRPTRPFLKVSVNMTFHRSAADQPSRNSNKKPLVSS